MCLDCTAGWLSRACGFVLVRYLEIPVGCHLCGTCCTDVLWHGAHQDAGAHAVCLVSEAVDCLMLGFTQNCLSTHGSSFFCSAVVLSPAAGCVGGFVVRERTMGSHGWCEFFPAVRCG